jgi:hypothetical protein
MLEFADKLAQMERRLDRFLPAPTSRRSAASVEHKSAGATFQTLCDIDDRLVAAGHHPLLGWWKCELERFYDHPTALAAVYRVGRGGAKSNTSVKVGCNEILNGSFAIPSGEIHYWAQVSDSKEEAKERLRLYESFFQALGIEFQAAGDSIIIPSLHRGVRVFACQIGAVSGFRCIGYSADEAAKWENRDHSANPAEEVIVSIGAMTVTHPGARSLIISSPWGTDDYHYELFEKGDTIDQVVASAPSWVANPSITREQCLKLAKGDEKILVREYEAIPGATVSRALDAAHVANAFEMPHAAKTGRSFLCIDASSLRGDAFAWCAGYESATGLAIAEVNGIEDAVLTGIKMGEVVAQIAVRAKEWGTDVVFGDQREEAGLQELFAQHGISLVTIAWTDTSKHDAFTLLRRLMKDGQLSFADHDKLKQQAIACKLQLMPSGRNKYATNGLDYLSAVVTLMHAVNAGDISLAPLAQIMVSPASMVKRYVSALNV